MKRKLAVFDVDGTLFDGNLGIEFIKVLRQKGFSTEKIGKEIMDWYLKYQSGEVKKSIAVDEIYKLHALGMKGVDKNKIKEIVLETWKMVVQKMFGFVPKIIKILKDKGYLIFLLSGSPIEMVRVLGNELKIDEGNIIAGEIEIVNGIYTGNIISYPGSAKQKSEALMKFIKLKKVDVDWKNSIVMGNNERDNDVLEKAGYPIAFSPNQKLMDKAKNNGWKLANKNTILSIIKNILINGRG